MIFIFSVALLFPQQGRKKKKKTKQTQNSPRLFLGFLKGVGVRCLLLTLAALIPFTICDTVSQKCCLAVLVISCVFKLKPPRLHSSVFSAPFIFLFPLIIEASIPSFCKCGQVRCSMLLFVEDTCFFFFFLLFFLPPPPRTLHRRFSGGRKAVLYLAAQTAAPWGVVRAPRDPQLPPSGFGERRSSPGGRKQTPTL